MNIKALKYSAVIGLAGFGLDYSAVKYVDFRNALPTKVYALGQNIADDIADAHGYEPKEGELTESIIAQVSMEAAEQDNEPAFARAVLKVESKEHPEAYSKAGAIGLMQVMPENAKPYGTTPKKLWEKKTNIRVGNAVLADCRKSYAPSREMIAACYNAGAGNVDKAIKAAKSRSYEAVKPYLPKQTQIYVGLVMNQYRKERA